MPEPPGHPHPTTEPHGAPLPHVPLRVRAVNLVVVLLPLAGLVAAIVSMWGSDHLWMNLTLLGAGYLLTALGVTVGLHRYFTHRSFETNVVVQVVLGVLGSMAMEGPILQWAATHRSHHRHSDRVDDPHSPHTHGEGVLATLRGFVHAHCGWLLSRRVSVDVREHAPDLCKDRVVVWLSRWFPVWAALGLLLPAAAGLVWTGAWGGALQGFLWGGLVRVFLVHHVTWSVNSICHLWGGQDFHSRDHSRNNFLVGALALGEGWHNNHHAFPASARHGLRWWQIDLSYLFIRTLALVGLARRIRQPTPERIERKRLTR